VLDGVPDLSKARRNFWVLLGPFISIVSHCCSVCSKNNNGISGTAAACRQKSLLTFLVLIENILLHCISDHVPFSGRSSISKAYSCSDADALIYCTLPLAGFVCQEDTAERLSLPKKLTILEHMQLMVLAELLD